jgi:hypothetical protein
MMEVAALTVVLRVGKIYSLLHHGQFILWRSFLNKCLTLFFDQLELDINDCEKEVLQCHDAVWISRV